MTDRGARLFSLVEAYASLGDHRTGTDPDAATLDWFAGELEARGAAVTRHPFTFDRYDGEWEVTAGGEPVASLPLFYEGVGSVDTADPQIAEAEAFSVLVNVPSHLEHAAAAASAGRGVVLLATTGAAGERLMVPNRVPKTPDGMPVVLVEGRALEALRTGPVRVRLEARITEGRSANVVGRFGEGPAPIIIGTPLSGWFACAGERGTGIAVTLDVAAALAEHNPVVVVGTSGHELGDLGLHRLLDQDVVPAAPAAVVHVGASVAAEEAPGRLSTSRLATIAVDTARQPGVLDALAGLELQPTILEATDAASPDRWVGEAREWSSLRRPLVSVTGFFPLMHTPDDSADAATSPETLERAARTFLAVGETLLSR